MEIKEKIKRLKREKNAVILVHNYQIPEVQELADLLGDSLDLSRRASETDADIIVFAGVRFMAETAKILSPQKKVLLTGRSAGCPLAEMITIPKLMDMKERYPDARVVSYVNTTAEIKAESYICCTSANAVKVVNSVDSKRILFVPDRNLASWVSRFTDREIIPANGFCYVHEQFTGEDVVMARERYPDAAIIVHPECRKEVVNLADEVFSTGGMVNFAKKTDRKVIIIGTEEGIISRLKRENPEKEFCSLGPRRICLDMKKTKMESVLQTLEQEKYEITIPEDVMERARVALERMLSVS